MNNNGNSKLNDNIENGNKKDSSHINDQKLQKTQHISESEKEEIVRNKDIIAKNKLEQEQLNKQIDYLKTQIEDVNLQIANNQNSINNIRKLLEEYFKTNENKNKENGISGEKKEEGNKDDTNN